MNRERLALGLMAWSIGLWCTIAGVTNKLIVAMKIATPGLVYGETFLVLTGLVMLIASSLIIAHAFPKKS